MEIPYIFVQTILFGAITYFMIGFEKSAGEIFSSHWYTELVIYILIEIETIVGLK